MGAFSSPDRLAFTARVGGAGEAKGAPFRVIFDGQAVSVAPNGQLFPVVQQAATPGKSPSLRSSSGTQKAKGSYTGWGFLGLGAAGAAGAVAALSHGGGKQPISPSSP